MFQQQLKRILKLHGNVNIVVQIILMDREFEKTFGNLPGKVVVNTTGANEHIGEIEHYICTVKKRCRAVIPGLPLKSLPKLIVTNVVYFVII